MTVENDGNVTIEDGNLTVATAHGIAFGNASGNTKTIVSNLLDDYEEGQWTAILTGGGGAPNTEVSTTAFYTKIGNVVNIFMRFSNKNTTGASGSMRITGLPFTTSSNTDNQAAIPMMHNLTVSEKYVTGFINGNAAIIDFINVRNNAAWTTTQINASTGVYLNMNMTYQTVT